MTHNYIYLKNGKIYGSVNEMPNIEHFPYNDFGKSRWIKYSEQWQQSLTELACDEIQKIKDYYFKEQGIDIDTRNDYYDVTSITTVKKVRQLCNKYKNQSSGAIGFATDYEFIDKVYFKEVETKYAAPFINQVVADTIESESQQWLLTDLISMINADFTNEDILKQFTITRNK